MTVDESESVSEQAPTHMLGAQHKEKLQECKNPIITLSPAHLQGKRDEPRRPEAATPTTTHRSSSELSETLLKGCDLYEQEHEAVHRKRTTKFQHLQIKSLLN